MSTRPYAVAAAVGAVLLATLAPSPAQALPPTTRVVKDAVQPGKAYDIVQLTLRSAPTSTRAAVVVVKHGRDVKFGDTIDAWFDLDDDKVPDIHVSGSAFSEYTVHKATSFTEDGKDISKKDCAQLAMSGSVSKIKLFPACVGSPISFRVSVKSSVDGKPAHTADWAPAAKKFTKRVLAAPLS
jgi:hypothetical protein